MSHWLPSQHDILHPNPPRFLNNTKQTSHRFCLPLAFCLYGKQAASHTAATQTSRKQQRGRSEGGEGRSERRGDEMTLHSPPPLPFPPCDHQETIRSTARHTFPLNHGAQVCDQEWVGIAICPCDTSMDRPRWRAESWALRLNKNGFKRRGLRLKRYRVKSVVAHDTTGSGSVVLPVDTCLAVAFSSLERILGECSTTHSPPVLFLFVFVCRKWWLACAH